MIWSYSTYRQFLKCPRQWFYKNLLANANAKDLMRKEAYYLSQLKSISAWRGDVVDKTISSYIVSNMRNGHSVTLSESRDYAKRLCRRQLDFARGKKYRTGVTKSAAGDDYCALYQVEYEIPISNADLKSAWGDIETAFSNFFGNEILISSR